MIAALTDALRIDAGDLDLLEVVIPEAELDESAGEEPPVDSRWDWVEQTAASKRSKGTSDERPRPEPLPDAFRVVQK